MTANRPWKCAICVLVIALAGCDQQPISDPYRDSEWDSLPQVAIPSIAVKADRFIPTKADAGEVPAGKKIRFTFHFAAEAEQDLPGGCVVYWYRATPEPPSRRAVASGSSLISRTGKEGAFEKIFTVPKQPGNYEIRVKHRRDGSPERIASLAIRAVP
jgi:hypothetical protein